MEHHGTMAARHRPRYLDEIMEVIVNMKEAKGSTSRRILDRVHNLLILKRKKGKVDPTQIKKALVRGVECGVLMKKNGKYKLGLDTKDYAIYRSWTGKHARQARTRSRRSRRKKRSHRRGRRGRRMRSRSHSLGRQRGNHYSSSDEADDYASDTSGEYSQSDASDKDDKKNNKKKKQEKTVQKNAPVKKRSSNHRSCSKGPQDGGISTLYTKSERSIASIKEINKRRSKSRSTSKLKSKRSSAEGIGDRNDKGHCMKDGKAPADNKQAPYCGSPDCLCNLCVEHNESK
ncbi:unnamed protein product [Acanthoscelides obtectus]|uniref:H15 domain-containing protein n=1 Tax=Acanthoscelides obtectus TaxID=200917 RepID=A0A9P0LHI4_ACAOB|nr:unnamed protein product [Acanthoscelides obtectus]CAK1641987.1 hypothetical protein AOBTE_LOCUS12775 [Acanthoscelides obtectus]